MGVFAVFKRRHGQSDDLRRKSSLPLTEMHTVSFSWFVCSVFMYLISIPVVCPAVVCSLGVLRLNREPEGLDGPN